MTVDYGGLLIGQLEFYWDVHLRPRLAGLTDDEYYWQPVPGCWTLRRGADGRYRLDGEAPGPSPAPVTTIAWRILHVGLGMSTRASTFLGDGTVPEDATMFDPRRLPTDLPSTARGALAFLDDAYQRWHQGIRALDAAGLSRPLGPRGAFFAAEPMAALISHVNREVMHHGGEICLLRDLHRAFTDRPTTP